MPQANRNVLAQNVIENPNVEVRESISSDRILPNELEQRVIKDKVVKFGLAADRPDGTTHTKAYFATDTGVLSMWDGSNWLTTTLT